MTAIQSAFGNNPVGAAGGALTGTYPNPGLSSAAVLAAINPAGGSLSGSYPSPALAVTGTNYLPPSFGTTNSSTAQTANLLCYYLVEILTAGTQTGVILENGATATGNVKVALYSADGMTLLASSGAVAQSGTFAGQFVPYSAPYAAAAGPYILAVMYSSSSATAASAVIMAPSATAAQGSFTLPSTVTPPTLTGNNQPLPLTGTY
jgi:hypothetical protein